MDKQQAEVFLSEAKRVLIPGGTIRLAVPDIRKLVRKYVEDNDADALVHHTCFARPKPKGFMDIIRFLLVGNRGHAWMYDGDSLVRLLVRNGFTDPRILEAGETTIDDPMGLDLAERRTKSVYVEAVTPRQ